MCTLVACTCCSPSWNFGGINHSHTQHLLLLKIRGEARRLSPHSFSHTLMSSQLLLPQCPQLLLPQCPQVLLPQSPQLLLPHCPHSFSYLSLLSFSHLSAQDPHNIPNRWAGQVHLISQGQLMMAMRIVLWRGYLPSHVAGKRELDQNPGIMSPFWEHGFDSCK